MSRRENEDYPKHPRQQALPLIWIFAAAALLLVAGVGVWWASASADSGVARMGRGSRWIKRE